MHLYLLQNPTAGRGRSRAFLDAVSRTIAAAGHRVTVYRSPSSDDLVDHARKLDPADVDVLVVIGGDGTIRAAVNATDAPPPWPIGVIPSGTANLLARETGMWPVRSPESVAHALVGGAPWTVDLMEMRRSGSPPHRALTVVSAGLDGAIVHAVERARSSKRASGGYGRWFGPGFGVLGAFTFPEIEVTIDGAEPRTCVSALVQNARAYGGVFTMSPNARLDSRRLEVVMIHARARRDFIRLALKAGVRRFHRDQQVRIGVGHRVRLHAHPPMEVQADGDPDGTTDLEIVVRPAALRLWRVQQT